MGFNLFGSTSESKTESTTNNADERQIAEAGGKAINTGGGHLSIIEVPDEAFELAETALITQQQVTANTNQTLSDALRATQSAARSESTQLGDKLIKIGIPAVALIFIVTMLGGTRK